MIGDNEANFPHKLLLTNSQFANLLKAFAKLTKPQLPKVIQSGISW